MSAKKGARRRAQSGRLPALVSAAILLTGLLLMRALDPPLLADLRDRVFDTFQRAEPHSLSADIPVRIVDIDEASLMALGQWPWPRTRLAELVQRLHQAGASAIAFDFLFPEPDRSDPASMARSWANDHLLPRDLQDALERLPGPDAAFAEAVGEAPVVLGFALRHQQTPIPPTKAGFAHIGPDPSAALPPVAGAVSNLPRLEEAARGLGSIALSDEDRDGVVRRVPMLVAMRDQTRSGAPPALHAGLALEALRVAQGASSYVIRSALGGSGVAITHIRVGAFEAPLTGNGALWVRYGQDMAAQTLSARDVLLDAPETLDVAGAIVFIGTSAAGLFDLRTSPLGGPIPGVVVHALAASQILEGVYLARPDWADGAEMLAVILLGMALIAAALRLRPAASTMVALLLIAAIVAAAWLAFSRAGLLLDPLYPALSALLLQGLLMAVLFAAGDRERRFVRKAFGQYLAPSVLARLERHPQALRLGGEERSITVLMTDVQGFTPLSERLPPEGVVRFLNSLMTPLTEAVLETGGTIDKYVGDALLAFWNAPLDTPDHTACALRSALSMRARLDRINRDKGFAPEAGTVRIGIGLHRGLASVGNMGSPMRFDYSAIGDTVNLAARIETASRQLDWDIVVSDAVVRAAPGFATLPAGPIRLKGKTAPISLHILLGDETLAASPAFRDLAASHRALLEAGDSAAQAEALERIGAKTQEINLGEINLGDINSGDIDPAGAGRDRLDAFYLALAARLSAAH